jgi:hypothetical protein
MFEVWSVGPFSFALIERNDYISLTGCGLGGDWYIVNEKLPLGTSLSDAKIISLRLLGDNLNRWRNDLDNFEKDEELCQN